MVRRGLLVTEWKDNDEFTTTYGTLKRSMVEAADAERERIVALLEKHGRTLVFGDDKTLLSNVIKLIESKPE
jgi:hypothetical protein